MTLRFVPPKQVAKYALFVDHGDGKAFFKTYDDVGYAKNAHHHKNWNTRHDAKILEMVDGEWYVLHDIKAETEYKDLPWVKEISRFDYYSRSKRVENRAKPMTREEYAEWRIKVEHERLEKTFNISLANN